MDVMNLLNNFAFPVVAFIVAVYALKYSYDKSIEQNNKYVEQIGELASAVNNNTIVLTKLVTEMEKNG